MHGICVNTDGVWGLNSLLTRRTVHTVPSTSVSHLSQVPHALKCGTERKCGPRRVRLVGVEHRESDQQQAAQRQVWHDIRTTLVRIL